LGEEVPLNLAWRWFCRIGIEGEPRQYRYPEISVYAKISPVKTSSFSAESANTGRWRRIE
jgi:hypothetical protein